jgi:hypothetical protein
LRRGTYHSLYADDDVFCFGRRFSGEVIVTAVNVSEAARTFSLPLGDLAAAEAGFDVLYPVQRARPWGSLHGRASAGQLALTLAPRSGVVLRAV